MQRISFLLKVKQDKIEEYKLAHQNVWPEMLDALRRNGWSNYSIFMRGDGTLFGYFEMEGDLKAAQAAMAREAINTKWQESMAPYFEGVPGTHADRMMENMEEVFHLD